MKIVQPYHAGELQIQAAVGERAIAKLTARSIADAIMAPAFAFLRRQQLFVLGCGGRDGCDATLLFGPPGFLDPRADGKRLSITLERERGRTSDPVLSKLAPGQRIGGLAIDLSTRKRLRINGELLELAPDRLELGVEQAYANCPKHITRRELRFDAGPRPGPSVSARGTRLTPALRRIITGADTCFVASQDTDGHADASHRGGPPGFVRVLDDDVLELPELAGNSMYNTLGNLVLDPRAALVIPDLERGLLLHLRGHTSVQLDGVAGRSWQLFVDAWQLQAPTMPRASMNRS